MRDPYEVDLDNDEVSEDESEGDLDPSNEDLAALEEDDVLTLENLVYDEDDEDIL